MTSPSCSRNSTSPSSRYAETNLFFTWTLMFMNCKLCQTRWVMQLINSPPLIWAHSLLGWLYETWSAVWMTYCPLYTSLSGRRYSILSAACLLCFLIFLLTVSIDPPMLLLPLVLETKSYRTSPQTRRKQRGIDHFMLTVVGEDSQNPLLAYRSSFYSHIYQFIKQATDKCLIWCTSYLLKGAICKKLTSLPKSPNK